MSHSEHGVRTALAAELEARGFSVAGDTVGLRGVLYVESDGDRAAGLFEFKCTAEEALESMYQGRWTSDLPPRFAVLPASETGKPELDLLNQAGLRFLLYDCGGVVAFPDLDAHLVVVKARLAEGR